MANASPFGDYSDNFSTGLTNISNSEKAALHNILDIFMGLCNGEARTGGFVDANRVPTVFKDQMQEEIDYIKAQILAA